jgi:hypothetical protein
MLKEVKRTYITGTSAIQPVFLHIKIRKIICHENDAISVINRSYNYDHNTLYRGPVPE